MASSLVLTAPSALKDSKMECARSDTAALPTDKGELSLSLLWGESFASLLSFIGFDRGQTTIRAAARKATFWNDKVSLSRVVRVENQLHLKGIRISDSGQIFRHLFQAHLVRHDFVHGDGSLSQQFESFVDLTT